MIPQDDISAIFWSILSMYVFMTGGDLSSDKKCSFLQETIAKLEVCLCFSKSNLSNYQNSYCCQK